MSKKIRCTLLVLLIVGVSVFTVSAGKKEKLKDEKVQEVVRPEPLVIETDQRNKNGTLTVYGPDGGVYYQYMGEIDVRSSGMGGKEVEVVIDLPSLPCSCFDDNGDFKD